MEDSSSIQALSAFISLAISGVLSVLLIIVSWKLFVKAGKDGWKSLIPFYNMWVMGEIIYGEKNAWKPFLTFVPFVGWIVSLVIAFRLPQVYGKETLWSVLNIFFPFVVLPIMAFGDAEYNGPIDATL